MGKSGFFLLFSRAISRENVLTTCERRFSRQLRNLFNPYFFFQVSHGGLNSVRVVSITNSRFRFVYCLNTLMRHYQAPVFVIKFLKRLVNFLTCYYLLYAVLHGCYNYTRSEPTAPLPQLGKCHLFRRLQELSCRYDRPSVIQVN
jgi:hypothetical protein